VAVGAGGAAGASPAERSLHGSAKKANSYRLLGPEKGLLFIEQIPGVAVRVMRNPDGKIETRESRLFAGYYEKN
jgi:hypothetical protein